MAEVGHDFFVSMAGQLDQLFIDTTRSRSVPVDKVDYSVYEAKVVFVVENSLAAGVGAVYFFPEIDVRCNDRIYRETNGLFRLSFCRCEKEKQTEKGDEYSVEKDYVFRVDNHHVGLDDPMGC